MLNFKFFKMKKSFLVGFAAAGIMLSGCMKNDVTEPVNGRFAGGVEQ